MRQNIPLAQIPIAEPCSMDWNQMSGDAQKKFCQGCQKHVHNLSAMTRTAAEQLLCESAGHLCIRYEFNANGTVKTLDYAPSNASRFGWKFWAIVGGMLGTLFTGAKALTKPSPPMLMGAMVAPIPTTAPSTQPAMMGGAPAREALMGDVMIAPPAMQPACPMPPTTQPSPLMGKIAPSTPATQPTE